MAQAAPSFSSFTSGELSDKMDGRTDMDLYYRGAKQLKNFVVLPQGNATRRPGTEFVGTLNNFVTDRIRLIPFEFNTEQTYILAFGGGPGVSYYFNVIQDGAFITETLAANIIGISTANPCVITTSAPHNLVNGDRIKISNVVGFDNGYPEINDVVFKVFDAGTAGVSTTFKIKTDSSPGDNVSGTGRNSYTSGGTIEKLVQVDLPTGFTPDKGRFTQSADVMFVAHPDVPPFEIARTSNTNWTVTNLDLIRGPLLDAPLDDTSVSVFGSNFATHQQEITFTSPTGSFAAGNIVRGQTSGATMFITQVVGTTITGYGTTGVFDTGSPETIEDTVSGATATIATWVDLGYFFLSTSTNLFSASDIGRLVKFGYDSYAKINAIITSTLVRATSVANEENRVEVAPFYVADTISFKEGDPSSTGERHNDRLLDSASGFVEAGFKEGMRVEIRGSSTGGNNQTDVLLVQVTPGEILFSEAFDFTTQAAGDYIGISGITQPNNGGTYQLGAFSEVTGYPAHVTFFEERLVFANTATQPQTLFFSVGGDYTNFTAGTDADDALIYTIASKQVNVIRYLESGKSLFVGTSGGEFNVRSTDDAPISPTNTVIKRQARYGSADVQPESVDNKVLFVQRSGRKLRELVYDFNTENYIAPDLTILADHVTESGIKEMALQREPNNNIWAVMNDGSMACLTYRREENVVAWTRHDLSRTLFSQDTGVQSVAVIPRGDGALTSVAGGTEDDVYFVVAHYDLPRFELYYHIVRLRPFEFDSQTENAFFVDKGIEKTGSGLTTIDGLSHLEGYSVQVLADGAVQPNKTVTNGQITLDTAADKVIVGLGYESLLQTMRLDVGSAEGSAQGKTKRIRDVTVRLYKTVGMEIGDLETNLDRVPFRDPGMSMTASIPLFTGDKTVEFKGGFDTDGFIFIKQDQPLPMTVTGIFPRIQTFDR